MAEGLQKLSTNFAVGPQDSIADITTTFNLRILETSGPTGARGSPAEFMWGPRPNYYNNTTGTTAGTVRIVHGGTWWHANSTFYCVYHNGTNYQIARTTGSAGLTDIQTLGATPDAKVGWAEWDYNGTQYLIVATGQEVWYIATNHACTEITDGDLPVPHVPHPIVLNGKLFLAKASTQDIYNSAVGDITAWAASTFIRAEADGNLILGLGRTTDRVVAFKKGSIETFRDAAIPAPNSPLLRVMEEYQRTGIINAQHLTSHKDVFYFMGTEGTSSFFRPCKWKVGSKVESLANETARFYHSLASGEWDGSGKGSVYVISSRGNPYIVFASYGLGTPITAGTIANDAGTFDFVYDVEQNMWLTWSITLPYFSLAEVSTNVIQGFPAALSGLGTPLQWAMCNREFRQTGNHNPFIFVQEDNATSSTQEIGWASDYFPNYASSSQYAGYKCTVSFRLPWPNTGTKKFISNIVLKSRMLLAVSGTFPALQNNLAIKEVLQSGSDRSVTRFFTPVYGNQRFTACGAWQDPIITFTLGTGTATPGSSTTPASFRLWGADVYFYESSVLTV